jgi:hypothetical protein
MFWKIKFFSVLLDVFKKMNVLEMRIRSNNNRSIRK